MERSRKVARVPKDAIRIPPLELPTFEQIAGHLYDTPEKRAGFESSFEPASPPPGAPDAEPMVEEGE